MNPEKKEPYVYAMRYQWLDAFYDRVVALVMPEEKMRSAVADRLRSSLGKNLLDVGCGTGSQAFRLAREFPGLEITGVDGDPLILERARRKLADSGLSADFLEGRAESLPFQDSSFDSAVSTMVFHHLSREIKEAALHEILRILKPGRLFLLMDFGPPEGGALKRWFSQMFRLFDDARNTQDNWAGRLPALMKEAGFEKVREISAINTIFGTVRLWECLKPASSLKPGY